MALNGLFCADVPLLRNYLLTHSRLALNSMTLNDFERQNRGFYGFFGDFGNATQVYHSQCGATLLSLGLCDQDREFGICILT